MFNSLNTLSEIIYQNTKKADNYIHKLSSIYRYVLENEDVDLIVLIKELELVNDYFELQKFRDGEKIRLNINIQKPENYKVVPLSIQALVENAIKHNISSKESPLQIKIWIENNSILVSNNLQKRNILKSSKTGLSNLKQRVSLLLSKKIRIFEDNKEFKVEIPVQKL